MCQATTLQKYTPDQQYVIFTISVMWLSSAHDCGHQLQDRWSLAQRDMYTRVQTILKTNTLTHLGDSEKAEAISVGR